MRPGTEPEQQAKFCAACQSRASYLGWPQTTISAADSLEMAWAKVILFERGDAWRRALRVCDAELEPVVETRSLAECRQELKAASASMLGLAITPKDAADVVELLHELPVIAPLARATVFAPPEIPFAKWEFLQAGAVHVIEQRRSMGVFARLARKHLARIQQSQTQVARDEPLEERFLAELPL